MKRMKLGIVSDTHIPYRAKELPKALVEGLQGVDFIIHAGDWQTLDVYEALSAIAPVDGVAGNTDGAEIIQRFGRKKIVSFGAFRIGVVHGDGGTSTTEKRAWKAFEGEHVDCVIFGHSHAPYNERIDGRLLFNPGSPTDKRRQRQYSFGIVTLDEEKKEITAKHIFYDDRSPV